ncbi:unnamed protein product, partial [Didymodactylos carnosus]
MDSKFSRLQEFVSETKNGGSVNNSDPGHSPSVWTRSIFSRDVFNTNMNRFNTFIRRPRSLFGGHGVDPVSTNGSSDDMNVLLKQGENDPILPTLSKKQRILGFMGFLLMGVMCMGLATLYIPVIVFKARKFALLFSFGSLFFLSSFSMLWGPVNHLRHLFGVERLPFTITYIGTLIGTIYYSVWLKSYFLTIIFAVLQIAALVWYVGAYIPGGTRVYSTIFVRTFKRFGEYVKSYGYQPKYYQGGLLPRPETMQNDPPDYLPPFIDPKEWSLENATFGQNDYIDILDDETIEHWQLVRNAPFWLRGFGGNELQHLLRRMRYDGKKLEEEKPQKYSDLITRIRYLTYKHNFKHYKRPWLARPTLGSKEPLPEYWDPRST